MNPGELTVLLPLGALCLWLTIFMFTFVDHFIYRRTYGHFLVGVDALQRQAGPSEAGVRAMSAHMQQAKTRYLARYLSNAASRGEAARLASEEYVLRVGISTLLSRASERAPRRRTRQRVALYALSRTSRPETLPVLERAIASDDELLSYAALDMLDIHGTPGAAEVLLRAFESGALPASRIATHLEHFRVDLTALYVSWLTGEHPKSRYWIAYLLGKTSYSERTAAILEQLLTDTAADVRKIALSALSDLDAPQLQPQAERMLGDPVFFVRTLAARILAKFPNAHAVQALSRRLLDENDAVQLAVKRSLVELGNVTLEHLPQAGLALDDSARATIAQITSSIENAQEALDKAPSALVGSEAAHVR